MDIPVTKVMLRTRQKAVATHVDKMRQFFEEAPMFGARFADPMWICRQENLGLMTSNGNYIYIIYIYIHMYINYIYVYVYVCIHIYVFNFQMKNSYTHF